MMIQELGINELYGNESFEIQKQNVRFHNLKINFNEVFGYKPKSFFSVPGRTEISGNHTDHNNGKVIAASINLDTIAAVSIRKDKIIKIYSEGYEEPFEVDTVDLDPSKKETGTTNALIRGVCAGLKKSGHSCGGFDAYISSEVLPGSGLSSSASVEVLIGTVLNYFYNNSAVSPIEIAKIGQFAENNYFMKPCGLMDQIACASGGIVSIDFKESSDPIVEKVNFDFSKTGYSIIVVHTGGSHYNLTQDYASIPLEMKSIASQFGRDVCRDVPFETFLKNIWSIREEVSDRAILRAYHFYKENERVAKQVEALNDENFVKFLSLFEESGNSSIKWLQNIYSARNPESQNITLALAMTEEFIANQGHGVCRIHGGGFEGTIQVFLPNILVEDYTKFINGIFKKFNIYKLAVREAGAVKVTNV